MRSRWTFNLPRLGLLALITVLLAAAPAKTWASATPTPGPHWSEEDTEIWNAPKATPVPATTATLAPTVTPTPTPSPTPTPGFEANFPLRRGTRLGFHYMNGTHASYQYLSDVHPPMIKLAGNVGMAAQARRDFPELLIVGRLLDDDFSLKQLNPIRAATKYVNDRLPLYRQYPDVDYWEGWNEPDLRGPDEWNWYAQFEGQRACLMQYYGYQTVIGNFSTGRPEFDEMLMFLPAIRIGLKCGAILGLHEYSAPTMQYGYGWAIPHRPAFPDRGVLTFRYRFWYEDIFKPLNLPIPLVFTEMGVDGAVGADRPGPAQAAGWKQLVQYWLDQGLGTDGRQIYADQLAWYDAGMRQDPYVIGGAIFTAGPLGPWGTYDIEDVIPLLTTYAQGIRDQ